MDANYRLKIKIGPHEFEAEGPSDVVQEQFRAFKDLIMDAAQMNATYTQMDAPKAEIPATISAAKPDLPSVDAAISKIMKVENRVVSLTVRAKNVDDAVLLLLYGQKTLRENDAITGGEVMEGLTATGGFAVGRVDRLLEKLGRDGDAIVIGERRGKRYRLTNAGLSKARAIATELIATVA